VRQFSRCAAFFQFADYLGVLLAAERIEDGEQDTGEEQRSGDRSDYDFNA
jgi:hypothetical protein